MRTACLIYDFVSHFIVDSGLDVMQSSFDDGKFGKVVKLLDSNGGLERQLKNTEIIEIYIFSCYHTKRPRKLNSSIRKIAEVGGNEEVIISLLQTALEEKRDGVISGIRKISKDYGKLNLIVEAVYIEAVMREVYRPKRTSTSEVSQIISALLNDEEFYEQEVSESTLESLRLRSKKMFRARSYKRLIEWLSNVRPRDENFGTYKFLLLAYRANGDIEKAIGLAKDSIGAIESPLHFDTILDLLYTVGDNRGIIQSMEDFGKDRITVRGNFILSRSLRKMGNVAGADRILEDTKRVFTENMVKDSIGSAETISNIREIGFSGDIETSEFLLHSYISKKGTPVKIIEEGQEFEIIDLFRDTLERQKRIRLPGTLKIAKLLIKNNMHSEALGILQPFVLHGISDSAELFELFSIAANGSDNGELVNDLIGKYASTMESATVDRMAHVLEENGMFVQHRRLCELVPLAAIDSFKFLRSYFNIVEKDSSAIPPVKMLIRISKKRKPLSSSIIYFIERFSRISDPSDIAPLVDTLRIDKITRIFCRLRVRGKNGSLDFIKEIYEDLMSLGKDQVSKSNFDRAIQEFINISHIIGEDRNNVEIVKHFGLDEEFNGRITTGLLRSMVVLSMYEEVRDNLEKFRKELAEIERWRFLIEIGEVSLVKEEMQDFQINSHSLSERESKSLQSILFKIGMFREFLDLCAEQISNGDFSLTDLTRYFFSLFKVGEGGYCFEKHDKLRRLYCHDAQKRATLGIISYDFGISDDFLEELSLAAMMEPDSPRIPLMITKAFLNLERLDIAIFFFRRALILGQRDRDVIATGKEIQDMIRDLNVDPRNISEEQIMENPLFTDAEVIRRLLVEIGDKTEKRATKRSKKGKKTSKSVAIQSHTLDIGGAERQATLLLNLLLKGKVRNSSFSLITHKIPNPSIIEDTYYRGIPMDEIGIIEYFKPHSGNSHFEDYARIIGHLNATKARRLKKMIQIYSEGDFDIAHTWQDYCNIYGGLAALISGVKTIIMSARTLPPPMKGKLASRQGRSYRECYKQLLNSDNVVITHNSEFGNKEYVKWLGIQKEKSITIYNGLDVDRWNAMGDLKFDLRSELGIVKNSKVVGFVGRFTTDKRPWLFLKVAEKMLVSGEGSDYSNELHEWYLRNDTMDEGGIRDYTPPRRDDELHFVMVGDGPQFETAKDIVDGSEILRGRVHLVGFSNQVVEHLRGFDCFLLTSKVEGLPNVIIEAQSCGIPIVATDAGGSKECFIDGETGLLADKGGPLEICELLGRVLSEEKIVEKTKKKGGLFVKEKFGIDAYTKSINDLYSGNLGK